MTTNAKNPLKSATGQEIRSILGSVDDELVMAILDTGASLSEIKEAAEWLDDNDYMGKEVGKPMDIRVARVHKLLEQDRERMEPYER
jgi:NCAIR mutase (PurE)-related protein